MTTSVDKSTPMDWSRAELIGDRVWKATEILLEPGREGINLLGEDPVADDDEEFEDEDGDDDVNG